MNPYESPPEQQPVPPSKRPPLPGDEMPLFASKFFRYVSVAAIIGLMIFLALLAERRPAGLMVISSEN